MKYRAYSRSTSGFSLLELLVACSITALLAAMMLSLFLGVTDSWRTDTARTDAFREARAALQLVTGELDKAVPWLENETVLEVGGIEGNRSLNYITRIPIAAQPADLAVGEYCGVQLFLAPSSGQSGAPRALYRRLIPSKTLLNRLQAGREDLFDASPTPDSAHTELIALNVTEFDAVYRDENFIQAPLPGSKAPGFLEIRLQVVGGRGARLYFDPLTSPATQTRVLRTEGRSFVQRVGLK